MKYSALILIITFAVFANQNGVSAADEHQNCTETEYPRYFEDENFAYEDYEYIISRKNLTWKEAYQTCACFNYTALYFESDEEFEHVTSQLEELGYQEDAFWTSGYALEEPVLKQGQRWSDAFFWLPNAEQINARYWDEGEPDNRSGRERCAALSNIDQEFSLEDEECQRELRFICKRRTCDCNCGDGNEGTTSTRGTTRRSSTRRTTTELVMILE